MIMTQDVITLKKSDSLKTAEQLFKRYSIRHIPVVIDNVIIDMLSYTDLLRLSFADITNDEDDNSVDVLVYNMFTIVQVMVKDVTTVPSETTIKEVAQILADREFHALPIVYDGVLIGIVTTTDLLNYFIK